MRKTSKCLIAIILVITMLIPISGISAAAASTVKFSNGEYQAEKITNPTRGSGETDGISYGDEADRLNNYAWSLAERNNDIYVGVNRNIYGGYYDAYCSAFGMPKDQETKWLLFDTLCNGDFPHTEIGAKNEPVTIIKVNPKDGKTKTIYTPPALAEGVYLDGGYRMMISYGDNIYAGTASSFYSRILRIDKNDNVTEVHKGGAASSFRAATIHNDKLYYGGIDSYTIDPDTDKLYNNYVIYEMNSQNDQDWKMVANYKDFDNIGLKTGYAGELWDIASFNGDIYVTFWGTKSGFAMYKGHEAATGEAGANSCGWVWNEVIGENTDANGGYKLGLIDDNMTGYAACGATPIVFKDEMYFGTFDGSMKAFMTSIADVFGLVSDSPVYKDVKLSDIVSPLYSTITTPQKLYKMNKDGVISEVTGINKYLEGTANDYLWRYEIYNDELYIGSFDCANIYTYITQFTDGRFFKMTPDELARQAGYIKQLLAKLGVSTAFTSQINTLIADLNTVLDTNLSKGSELTDLEKITNVYNAVVSKIDAIISSGKADVESAEKVKSILETVWSKIDVKGLEMCYEINDIIANEDLGFDLFSTKDGVNFTAVTTDGFGDKYNYGCRTLLTTDDGLLVGTANPYYGAQVWNLTSKNATQQTNSFVALFMQLVQVISNIWQYYIPAGIRKVIMVILPKLV